MVWFGLLLLGLTMADDGKAPPLGVAEVDSAMQARARGGEVALGPCLLIVDLDNKRDAPLEVAPEPLEVRDAGDRVRGRCRYERGVVWETTPTRRRFQTFKPPLAAGEQVQVKLFYTFEAEAGAAPPQKGEELRYRARFTAAGATVELTGEPFKLSWLEGL